ncbi:feruloyl esterase [Sphingobium subterraneum]|uniref:Feruloyl esterase n=1 Tax=Sphingobium subterraneum TaxID=627688 RepID=A0A841J3F2_9SPHN|nr:feruloyl esterase [Sphingobium subterraneum]
MSVPADRIGLPTSGAKVVGTAVVDADGPGSATSKYCLVNARIMPVDPQAPNIEVKLALPWVWNGKAAMMGGAGYGGTIYEVAGNLLNAAPGSLSPLARGYAVFADDSGHQSSYPGAAADGAFLVNDEARHNWMGDSIKKTRDVAVAVMQAAYGRKPLRSYFLGSSTGGRQALQAAGRWPADWDGVVSLYPARNVTTSLLGMLAATQALSGPGHFLTPEKRGVLRRAALAACDSLDGAKDGIISNVKGCSTRFDPATATLNGIPVRCPDGQDTGDTCLSNAQIATLKSIDAPLRFQFSLASGSTGFPGFNILLSDSGVPDGSPLQPMMSAMSVGAEQPATPLSPSMAMMAHMSASYIRYAVTNSPGYDPLTFDVVHGGGYALRLSELSVADSSDNDLAPFAAKGGKVLMLHGTEDLLVSSRGTAAYYDALVKTMGATKLSSFLRYYQVPGFGHSISPTFNLGWDQLSALENWVEKGIDPAGNQIGVDTIGVPGRTRPLCIYPGWPRYTGKGDINNASSFRCVTR